MLNIEEDFRYNSEKFIGVFSNASYFVYKDIKNITYLNIFANGIAFSAGGNDKYVDENGIINIGHLKPQLKFLKRK